MLPPYVILSTFDAVEYFVDRIENYMNAHEFLVEVLHDFVECMEDWADRDEAIRSHIEYTLYENGFIEASETECSTIRDCILKVTDAIIAQVVQHDLVAHGAFPYQFHEMLGYNIVLIRSDYKPQGVIN